MTSPQRPRLPIEFEVWFRDRPAMVKGTYDLSLNFSTDSIVWTDGLLGPASPDYNSITDQEWTDIHEEFQDIMDPEEDEDYASCDYDDDDEAEWEDDEDDDD